jgi:hypothetical protein
VQEHVEPGGVVVVGAEPPLAQHDLARPDPVDHRDELRAHVAGNHEVAEPAAGAQARGRELRGERRLGRRAPDQPGGQLPFEPHVLAPRAGATVDPQHAEGAQPALGGQERFGLDAPAQRPGEQHAQRLAGEPTARRAAECLEQRLEPPVELRRERGDNRHELRRREPVGLREPGERAAARQRRARGHALVGDNRAGRRLTAFLQACARERQHGLERGLEVQEVLVGECHGSRRSTVISGVPSRRNGPSG